MTSDVFYLNAHAVRHEAKIRKDRQPGEDRRPGVSQNNNKRVPESALVRSIGGKFYIPDDVVMEIVVAGERDQTAPAGREGEENLSSRIFPNRHVLESLPLRCQEVFDTVQGAVFCESDN